MDTFLIVLMSLFAANFLGAAFNGLILVATSSQFDSKPEDILWINKVKHTLIMHLGYALFWSITVVLRVLAIGGALK